MLPWMVREELIHCLSLRENELFVYNGQSHIVTRVDKGLFGINLETGEEVELSYNTKAYRTSRKMMEVPG